MTAIAHGLTMVERQAPSRPSRLGTRRRRAHSARVSPEAGASRSRTLRAPSLDTRKQLATTAANWLKDQETPRDRSKQRERLWLQLKDTVYQIWQDSADLLRTLPNDGAEFQWWADYEGERAKLKADENPAYDAWLQKYVEKHGLPTCPEAYLHSLYMTEWKKKNKPVGRCAHVLRWEKQYFQLLHCQGEWIGYRAECCSDQTRAIAVPIGCNHRLCPLCSWHRSEKAQRKTKTLFSRLEHPQFITLTTPNLKRISKRTYEHFRKRVRQFLAQHSEFDGGIYAIETTYNRTEKSWHVHAHAMVNAPYSLPSVKQRVVFAGRNMPAFTLMKLALEYDWTRIWVKELPKLPRKNAAPNVLDGERYEFESWVLAGFENALKERRGGEMQDIQGLSELEIQRRTQWNKKFRRVMWIKSVDDRERAAKEVLKYITKSADFCDLPQCVEAFYDATKGARMVQTFGTWYGVNFDAPEAFLPDHMENWGKMECQCGLNHWTRIGTFHWKDVQTDEDGRSYLKRSMGHNTRGTVARPTIRALDSPVEAF